MAEEIQKQNDEWLTWQKQPERFLAEVGTYLATVQMVYRTQLPTPELVIWRETLKDYSLGEFRNAINHLVANPPRYELEDGSIQVWRGMPKLPDVVNVMLDQREKAVQEARRREGEQRQREFRELERRRKEHPEEFFGLGDLLKDFKNRMPASDREPTEEELAKRRQKMKDDLEKSVMAKGAGA